MKQIILFILVFLPVCVFAQFTETFDGPDINSANPWTVRSDRFAISNGQLMLNGASLVDTCMLFVPIDYAPTMEWEFDVSFSFKPSNLNKVCIYLYRTNKPSDLIFYVQVGSNDNNVSFYKYPPKGKPQSLIVGKRELKERKMTHVKLTLKENKYWTLYTRFADEDGYTKEGAYTSYDLQDFRDSGNLNISCICNASSYPTDRYYYLDNIVVRHALTDTPLASDGKPEDPGKEQPSKNETPRLLSLEEEEDNSLLLTFDMPVDATSASIELSGEEADELYQSDDDTALYPVWAAARKKGESYVLSYAGIYSKAGTGEGRGSKTFASALGKEVAVPDKPTSIPAGAVLINEVMADPKGVTAFPETEYIELYNTTDKELSLKDWLFVYDNRVSVSLTDVFIPRLGYTVLYRAGREIFIDSGGTGAPLDKFPSQLANTGKQLRLISPSGVVIDEYDYPKAIPGKSWERSLTGWHLSSDPRGGTPGAVNSSGEEKEEPESVDPEEPENPDRPSTLPAVKVEPKEFIFNELLPNPFAGGSEYIELYNRSDHPLPLSGLSVAIRKTDGSLSTRYLLSSVSTLIEPDSYVVLTKNKSGVADFYTIQSPAALFEIAKLPILANTSSTLVLFRTEDETIIDEVSYSFKWHASSVKNQQGVALERINPEAETQSPANWTSASATAGYGTPGYRNSQSDISSPNLPDLPTGIKAPEWVPESDYYKITYYLDQPGYSCRAFIFNTSGQRVAEVANNELLGLSGQLTWDGSSLARTRLRAGVYIFYAELYHTGGTVKRYKQVFLVR